MRKRLFIFAAATCFALSAFATPAFAEEPSLPDGQTIGSEASVQSNGNSNGNVKEDALPGGSDDALPDEESYSDEERSYSVEGQANSGAAAPVVVKIGNAEYEYETLQEAINVACNDTTSSDATITLQDTLQGGLTLDDGLRFIGSGDTAGQWKNITLDAANHSLTLNNKGIYATRCKVTIKNCPELTVNAGTNPGATDANKENANISAVFFCPGTLILDNCETVNITNPEPETGGSGLCIYNGGDLYIKNYTRFTVSGFMNGTPVNPGEEGKGGCSGIYIDSDTDVNENYKKITGQIVVSNNSTLTATECYHNGITANPVNVNVTNNSEIKVYQNGDASNSYAHQGGIGCYYGTMTISDHSRVISENNGSAFGIFVHNLDVDGTSEIESRYDTIYGIAFDGDAVLQSGTQSSAKMTSVGHFGPGIALYYGTASLTVQKDAVLSSSSNHNVGLANGGKNFNVLPGANVYLNDNLVGLDNYPNATTTVEAGAHLEICRNGERGIKNGNNTNNPGPGTLILNAGLITENNKLDRIPYKDNLSFKVDEHEAYGGGIYNAYGTVSLSPLVKVYNNKAVKAGDDLYNDDTKGYIFNIIKLEPGAKWSVLDDDEKIIDDWYHDDEGKDNRWKPETAKNNTVTDLPLGAALKAAHGINAPTPSPTPATPKPAEPTAAPTVAPTAAPTAVPTTAPADNTATAAPATPVPTARPAVTATPAPTAQASGVIPQTGDSSSPALFSILTLGSITALCVLQKRRKSK